MKLASLTLIFIAYLAGAAFAQTTPGDKAKAYQDQKRAFKLSLLSGEIKALEDAPMRCFARIQIARFIFDNKVTSYLDTANSSTLDCLEDIQNNFKEFGDSEGLYEKAKLLALLRVNSPDVSAKAEKKYLAPGNTFVDLVELDLAKDLRAMTDRVIAQMMRGDMPADIYVTLFKIKERDPVQANRLLDAVLSYLETRSDLTDHAITLRIISWSYADVGVPSEIRTRFLRFVLRIAQNQTMQSQTSMLYETTYEMLGNALPAIKELIPTLYEQAAALYLVLGGKMSTEYKDELAAYRRINESKDKLQQAISEAEAAQTKPVQNGLWQYASELALKEKKFKISVDCRLKIVDESKSMAKGDDHFLINDVIPQALKENDIESADYALKRIESVYDRASGNIKIAAKCMEMQDRSEAFVRLESALKLLEKADDGAASIRIMVSSIPTAMDIDKSKAFEVASLAIKRANRLPTPGAEDKTGSPARVKYVTEQLVPTAYNLAFAVRLLARSDAGFASATVEEIRSRNWRLAAEIVVETERLYPLPKEPRKTPRHALSSKL